ncbi:MAG: hypothetical protein IJ927_02115, partial [Eubacterium sp.]|nr:hypothetical protein [Eubacterium sp.]
CTECHTELSREAKEIDMLAHTAGEIVIENRVESTCVQKGSYDEVVYCTECNAELSRTTITLDLAEHSYRIEETVLPTCTSQGYTTYICSVCKDTYDDNFTDMISHKAGSAVRENEIPSTCSKKGSYDEVVYCTECHTELSRETKDIEMIAHTAVTDEAVASTCTQTGLTEGSHCSVCGKVLVERQVTPMAEHTWDDGEVIQQATSTQEGIVKYTCTACHAVKTETIEKLAGKGKFVASNVSSKAGKEISIEIYIEENPGITSLSIDVAYPEGLTLVSVTDEKLFGSGFSKGKLNSNPIALSWYKSDSSNDDSTGLFATLTFAIDEELPVGDYPIEITFDPDNIFDNEFNNVEFDVENGNVNIYSVIPGDIYQDDEINMKDIVLLQQYINRWDVEIDTEIADVNKDGKINMKDLVLIQQYINGWDVVLQ